MGWLHDEMARASRRREAIPEAARTTVVRLREQGIDPNRQDQQDELVEVLVDETMALLGLKSTTSH